MNEGRIRTIVLGIFLHEDRLLVFRGDDPARDVVFYRPLGGGVEFGERSADAFVREMREELGAELTGNPLPGDDRKHLHPRGQARP